MTAYERHDEQTGRYLWLDANAGWSSAAVASDELGHLATARMYGPPRKAGEGELILNLANGGQLRLDGGELPGGVLATLDALAEIARALGLLRTFGWAAATRLLDDPGDVDLDEGLAGRADDLHARGSSLGVASADDASRAGGQL